MAKDMAVALLLMLSVIVGTGSGAEEAFDVRKHLCTVTRYDVVKDVANNGFVPSSVSNGCTPIHLNLVARHGTRSPTTNRQRELEKLESNIQSLLKDAKEKNLVHNVPAWLQEWISPWKGKMPSGELISKGEDELRGLGIRIRERFPELFGQDYHPDVYTMNATGVNRTKASAEAFGMGLFSGKGTLGPGNDRVFAVNSEASDRLLRFHDCCENYKDLKKKQGPLVQELKEPILDEITEAITSRYKLNFTRQDTSSLWFLCKQEASLLDVTNQACALFNPDEIALLEWTDDLEAFMLKGYGEPLNYRMGLPLLKDVVQSMEEAILANEEKRPPGSYEKARLRFAHAETLVPFTCLLGLFLERSEFEQIQREQPLPLPPKPPQERNWTGSIVAPFGGNNMLVLYSCPANLSSKYYVQVLHNEHPTPMPGCGYADFCSFEVFKEEIADPHLKHDFDALCNEKTDQAEQNSFQHDEL